MYAFTTNATMFTIFPETFSLFISNSHYYIYSIFLFMELVSLKLQMYYKAELQEEDKATTARSMNG